MSVLLMGALPPVAGSAISFLLAAFFLWGLLLLALGRFEFRLTHSDRAMAWTFTIFAALVFATGLLAEEPLRVFGSTVWLLPFLSLWVVIPRLRASPQLDYLRLYISGAIAGCIGAFLILCVQILWLGGGRLEGGAGNAAIFASMCLCLVGFAGLAIDTPRRTRRLLAAVAVLAGTLALILSLTRGVMVGLVPVLILLLVYARRRWRAVRVRRPALLLLAISCLVLYGAWDMIESRIAFTSREVEVLLDGGYTTSMGERLRLWSAAWLAFLESPLWGHGIQDRMQALLPYLAQDGLEIRDFTHPHNSYLAFAVDGGLIVLAALLALLAAPVVLAWRAPRDRAWRRRLFMALVLTAAYATIGLTQIMFKHDILDSFYIFTAIVLAASIPDAGEGRRMGAESEPRRAPAGGQPPAGRIAGRLLDFAEAYMFPVFAFLVAAAGTVQPFLPSGAKEGITSFLGF